MQPFAQLRPAASARDVAHRDGDGLLLPDQHNQPLAACDASVEQVSLQHRVMLSEHWDDHRWIFGALAFVNGRRVSGHQHVEFAKAVSDGSAVKAGSDLACIGVDIVDISDIAVINFLVIIVLDLHDFVTRGEGPAEPLHFAIAGGIEGGLQFNVQRPRTHPTAIHRAEDLDVADGIEAEAFGDSRPHQFDDTADGGFRIVRLHEVKVALCSRRAKVGDRALIYAMGSRDDAALRGLAEYFGEAHHGHSA
jgi:hypothetical protein